MRKESLQQIQMQSRVPHEKKFQPVLKNTAKKNENKWANSQTHHPLKLNGGNTNNIKIGTIRVSQRTNPQS